MISYTLQELAYEAADAPSVVVFPRETPRDAMRRFFEGRDVGVEDALADVIVVPCESHDEASELSKRLEANFVHHLHIREDP